MDPESSVAGGMQEERMADIDDDNPSSEPRSASAAGVDQGRGRSPSQDGIF